MCPPSKCTTASHSQNKWTYKETRSNTKGWKGTLNSILVTNWKICRPNFIPLIICLHIICLFTAWKRGLLWKCMHVLYYQIKISTLFNFCVFWLFQYTGRQLCFRFFLNSKRQVFKQPNQQTKNLRTLFVICCHDWIWRQLFSGHKLWYTVLVMIQWQWIFQYTTHIRWNCEVFTVQINSSSCDTVPTPWLIQSASPTIITYSSASEPAVSDNPLCIKKSFKSGGHSSTKLEKTLNIHNRRNV